MPGGSAGIAFAEGTFPRQAANNIRDIGHGVTLRVLSNMGAAFAPLREFPELWLAGSRLAWPTRCALSHPVPRPPAVPRCR
jgi:hypothetical protein